MFVGALGLNIPGIFAQTAPITAIPFHADPNAKTEVPDPSLVPAIRFLTSADFPPFNFRDGTGKLTGFNFDLAEEICGVLDVACTVQAWPFEQVADALADNQGDALIAGLAISEETATRFDFSNPYLMLPARFVTLMSEGEAFDVKSLSGAKISVRANSSHANFLRQYAGSLELLPFGTETEGLAAMRSGEADAYFGDAMFASFWLNDNDNCCTFTGEAYFSPTYFGEGLAVAFPAGRGAVREAVNYALALLKRNGKLDELYLRWFPISFY